MHPCSYQIDLLATQLLLQRIHFTNHAQHLLQRSLQCRAATDSLLDTDLKGKTQHSKLELELVPKSQELLASNGVNFPYKESM